MRLGFARLGLRLYYTAPYQFSVLMFRAPVLVPHLLCLGLAWLGSRFSTLLVCSQQIPYDIQLPSSTSSGTCCHTLAWLSFAWFSASARLYYTAPDRFSVSMFRAPVLVHLLGLAWLQYKYASPGLYDIKPNSMHHHTIVS